MTKKDKQLSLSIKPEENKKAMPLGIKSSVEGIEHFTNWDNIVNSIGETGDRLRTDDQLYNNLKFKTKRYSDFSIRTSNVEDPLVYEFDDKWSVNKIKILDDLAFVAEDEYSHVEKSTKTLNTKAYQYFVEKDFVGVVDNDNNAGDDTSSSQGSIITPGSASWTSSGAYTGHMPFMPGSGYSAGPYAGGLTIKYVFSTNTFQITGTIPGTGGWGGAFSGSATYDACSGGSATNVDVTITGTHYCTATSQNETYSGTIRLNISPGNSGDESTCSAAITINSVSWGTPSQYSSSGGCYITYSASSLSYDGYTSPVYDDPPDPPPYINRNITIQRRIGSLTVQTELPELSSYGNLADGKHMTPLTSDFEHLYIRLNISNSQDGVLADHYLKFGGFVYNDFGKSNIYTRDAEEETKNGREDLYTLGGIDFTTKNRYPNRKLKDKNADFGIDTMGAFVPPGFGQDNANYTPVNYSQIQAPAYPIWRGVPSRTEDVAVWQKWYDALKDFGWTGKEQIFEEGGGVYNLKPEIIFGGQAWADGRNLLGDPTPHAGVDPNVTVPLIKGLSPNAQRTIPTQLDEVQDVKFQPAIMDLGKFSPVHQGGFKNESPDTAILPDITFGPKGFSANSEGSFGGYYYLIYDVGEEDSDQPKIVGIQFDQVLNSISGGYIEQETVADFGDRNDQARLMKSSIDVRLDFVKILPVRKCGKVDIYKRKSGIVQSIDQYGRIVSTGHGLQDGDTVEISGALYETSSTGTGDIHPLNNKFSIGAISENSFSIQDAPSSSVLNNLRGDIEWRSVSNDQVGKTFEGWSYQGTIFSPTGKNGYFQPLNQNNTQISVADPQNRVATESEFFTSERIDISNLDSGFLNIDDNDTGEYVIRDLVNLLPEASEGMNLFSKADHFYANINYGTSASEIYPYISTDVRKTNYSEVENYLGGRFGCDIDVEFSNDSGSSKVYTIAIGERGSDVSVDLFGLEARLCLPDSTGDALKFVDSKRAIPQYLPYGKTHVINIRVDQFNNVSGVEHKDTLFGGGNGIVQGKQPRGNDLLDQTERNPWTDFENLLRQPGNHHAKTSQISLSEILQYEEQYLGNYLNPRGRGSRSRYFKSAYWERHAVVHWFPKNIPNIHSFRGGQIDGVFLDLYQRNFGRMNRPILLKGTRKSGNSTNKITTSYFGKSLLNGRGIDRFNDNNRSGQDGYWSIFPWVDSYGKAVSIRKLENMHDLVKNVGIAVLSASTSKANRTFNLDQTELPALSYPDSSRQNSIRLNKDPELGQLNLVYLQTNFGVSYNQSGYTQICAGGSNGFATRDFSFANEFSSGFTGTKAGQNLVEAMNSCHLSYSDVVLENDRIIFSEQVLAENRSIIHFLNFNPSSVDPISKDHTISKLFTLPRDTGPAYTSAMSFDTYNVGNGFGSNFKIQKDLLLTNATDVEDEFEQIITPPDSTSSNVISSVRYGIDQIFVYEKLKETFEFSQKITATTTEKVTNQLYTDRRLKLTDDLTVPLSAMNYKNKPNGTYAWNIKLAGRYDVADTKIVLQDPYSVAIFDRDFSESEPMIGRAFTLTPNITSVKIEKFDHQDTSTLTYEDSSQNVEHKCRINVADYRLLRGEYYTLPEQAPVINYNLDGDEDFYISSMKINFKLKNLVKDISTTFRAKIEEGNNLIPRVVLYSRDPQGIVTRNRSTDLTSSSSSFYSLDETRKSKKSGGYIAPENAATSDILPQYNAGFMGQHRGGAQDLFFYGTLEGSDAVTAQEVFAGDVPRTTLPYTYGGSKNLADFTGGCSWIAPDVYHKFSSEQIANIKPYAKIFKPIQQADGSYSITLTSDDLNFDDYIDKGRGGIWLGFVLTNVNSFDINTCQITYEELATGEIKDNSHISYLPIDNFERSFADSNIGPYKYILPATTDGLSSGSMDMSRWFNARYPYCKVGIYPGVDKQGARTVLKKTSGKGQRTKSLACFAEATVVNPSIELSGFVTEGRRYKTSFSNSAIVNLKDDYTQKDFDGEAKSVVAIGKSNTSANTPDLKDGSFGTSYQILTSTDGFFTDQNSLINKPSNIISSFDVQRPEFLSLIIAGDPRKDEFATLFTPAPVTPAASGINLTLAPVTDTQEILAPLFTGQRDFEALEPLFLKADISENDFTLNIYEIQPSSIMPLMVNVIDASGGINLNFAPPTTGSSPLFTQGPIISSGLTSLTSLGSVFLDQATVLATSGAFHSSGIATLHTVASVDVNNAVTLAMNLPQSGSVPLYIRKDFDASGQAPLTIFDKAPHSGNLNLFTGTQFDVDNKDLSIFIDVPNIATGQLPFQIDGFALTANSNRNSNTSFISKFADGEFDKGDVDGNFNEDLISKTSPSKTVLSNSALGNAVNENFYDRNRNLVLDKNLPLQTDSNYSSTFVSQKFVGNRPSPTKSKKGTSDPAWNLAFGKRARNSTVLYDDVRTSRIGISSRGIIRKFYTNDTYNNKDRFRYIDSGAIDFTEKEFYDTNGKVLVKAGLMNQSLSNASNSIEICIYDIDDDGNLSQRGKGGLDGILRFSPCSIPLKDDGTSFARDEELEGTTFSSNRETNNLTLDIGGITDSFWPIRQEIFSAIKSDFIDEIRSENATNQPPFSAHFKSCGVEVLDLKLSDDGMCAISFRVISDYDFYYKDGPESGFTQAFTKRKDFNHITTSVLIFDIGDYLGAKATFAQNFNPEIDNYYHIVMPKEQNNQTKNIDSFYPSRRTSPFTASSLAFDYEDLYVNVQDGFFRGRSAENVIKLAKDAKYDIFNVNTFTKISFDGYYLADAIHYNNYNNKRYITDATEGYNKAFFGGKIKIFKEYQSSKSIMLVGAMLLDPYVLQNLSRSHSLNPFGAVYIYKKDQDQDDWDYHGAVYGKGYTSENIASNLSEFDTGSTYNIWNRRVGMFGYDFDYSDGVLFVSEPGGTSEPEYRNPTVSAANIYSFDISSAPTLIKTYNSSDISINSSSLATGDNVGTHIAAFGRQDVFGFSDAALEYIDREQYSVFPNDWINYEGLRFKGESLIHNFRNNSSFGFGSSISGGILEYSRENTLNELRPYFTDYLKTGAYPELSSVMQVWSRILSIKKISSNNKDRLLVVRKFAFRLNDYNVYSNNSFNVVKLQVVDLERDFNGPLFVKAANAENNTAPLFNLAPGPSGKFDLAIKPIDFASGSPPLFLDNRVSFGDMPLHTPHVDEDGNVFLPLTMDAFAPSASGDLKLFLKHQYVTAAPDLFIPAIGLENSNVSLAAQGSFGEGVSASPSLVINKHIPGIPESGSLGLFLNQKDFSAASLFEAGGPSNPEMDLVIGTFVVGSGVNQAPLTVKTFIPPIGPGGGYVGSGLAPLAMAGNNDANIFFKKNNNISLILAANDIANSGNVLFIEKAYGDISPLYIDSRISSGNVPTYVTGAGLDASGISLITKVAETGNFNIFTRGFFD